MKILSFLTLALCVVSSLQAEAQVTPDTISNADTSKASHFDSLPQTHPEVSMFVEFVNKAELKDLFNGTGPFTVFAPNNEAFKKLGTKVDDLSKPEKRDDLSDLLIYHVVPGKYMSKTLKTSELATINGKKIKIEVENGEIKVNGAKVVTTDVVGPNGVLHIIDTVLHP